MVLSSCLSLMRGLNWRQMSTKVTLGASNVAGAVDLMADSKAPKKQDLHHKRHVLWANETRTAARAPRSA